MKNGKIKILHVIDKFSMDGKNPSSCAILFKDWSTSYSKNFDVSYCGLKKPDPGSLMLEELGCKVFYLNKGKYSFSNITGLQDLIDKEKIDLIHLHGYSSANFGRIAAYKKKIPAIVHEHAILKVQPHQYFADFFLKNYTTRGIAVAEAVKKFMIKGRSVPEEKIDIVYNSVNINSFKQFSQEDIDHQKEVYHIPQDYHVVGTITRLREEKGNQYLIRAVPQVLKKYPKTIFLIVGDGPLRKELETLVTELQIEKNVVFTGFCNNVPLMLASFDIKVMPSLTEGCPYALIEAMVAGKPIVATNVGGIGEIIEHEKTGLLVPSKNPEKIAENILTVISNKTFATKLGKQAKIESQKFSIENTVRQIENIYNTALGLTD